MFSVIRSRLCYANVVATLALVFAMSGGALAAGHYLLTSTSQVSPKVLKALRGRSGTPGPAGSQGAAGPQGPAGAQGSQGPKGETGAAGAAGVAGAIGAQGLKGEPGAAGKEGSPWTAGGTLPSGKTETGAWAIYDPESQAPIRVAVASFAIPLAEPPTFHMIGSQEGEGEPRENEKAIKENEERKLKGEPEEPLPIPTYCKGTVTEPGAVSGNLCVFEYVATNLTEFNTEHNSLVSEAGAVAIIERNDEEEFHASGTWAVTAK
jgi:hypothetical protein